MNGFGSFESTYIYNQIDQSIEIRHRTAIADLWTFDPSFFGLTIDAFGTGALGVDDVIEWALPV